MSRHESDTPRTDEYERVYGLIPGDAADYCRTLERELNDALREIGRLQAKIAEWNEKGGERE